MNQAWTLLRTSPQNQDRYIEYLGENLPSVEPYFPQYEKITRPSKCRHTVKVKKPVYPGYVFAKVDLESEGVLGLIRTPIRAYFIRFGNMLSIVPECVIVRLRQDEADGKLVEEKEVDNPYTPGRKIRVHLPIADIDAVIVHLVGTHRVLVDTVLGHATVRIHSVEIM